ncbi:MAG: hypothetical protein DRJ42_28755 [Deltaproteobacteria bacterium]|nr:MAG: hypothetical protein DRJ42_28755 [Deltaproteobacteria bacterium]
MDHTVARCLVFCFVLPLGLAQILALPEAASAQEIVLATPESAVDSVQDNPLGGTAETVIDSPFISLQASREWRAFAEYDVTAAAGAVVDRAVFEGAIAVNNALDTGTRTVELSIYSADGTVTLDDFNRPTVVLGSVSYAPPSDSRVTFSYDVRTEVAALLAAGATHIGFRARSTVRDAPNVLTGLSFTVATNCGNGVVDAPEECDDGTSNSDTAADACRTACLSAYCGDGVVDMMETCDEGDDNGPAGTCSATCGSPAPADSGTPDGGTVDSGAATDSGTGPDSGTPDGGASTDSGTADSATGDAETPPADTSVPGPPAPVGDSGCACKVTPTSNGNATSLFLVALALAGTLRRRRSTSNR